MIQPWDDGWRFKRELDEALKRIGEEDVDRWLRLQVMRDVVVGGRSLRSIENEHGVSHASVHRWTKLLRQGGVDALLQRGRGRTVRPSGEAWDAVASAILETRGEDLEKRLRVLKLRCGLEVTRGTFYAWQRLAEKKTPAPEKEPAVEVDLFA